MKRSCREEIELFCVFFTVIKKDCATFSTLNLKIPNPSFSSSSSFSMILLHPMNNSQRMSNYLNFVIHTSNSILNSMNEWRIKIFLNHYDVIRVPKTLFYCVIKSQLICIFLIDKLIGDGFRFILNSQLLHFACLSHSQIFFVVSLLTKWDTVSNIVGLNIHTLYKPFWLVKILSIILKFVPALLLRLMSFFLHKFTTTIYNDIF